LDSPVREGLAVANSAIRGRTVRLRFITARACYVNWVAKSDRSGLTCLDAAVGGGGLAPTDQNYRLEPGGVSEAACSWRIQLLSLPGTIS
jgi:hypothetical protein